jgi:hypothetical protein
LESRGDCYRYNDSRVDNAAQVPSTCYLLDTVAQALAMYYRYSYSSESLVFCAWCRIMHEVVITYSRFPCDEKDCASNTENTADRFECALKPVFHYERRTTW